MVKSELYNPFVVPFIKVSIGDWNIKKQKILSLTTLDNKDCDPNLGGYKSDYFKYRGSPPYKSEFWKILAAEVNEIKSHFKTISITDLWHQEYVGNEFHGPHNHGGYGYSAVMYAEFNSEFHEPTHFLSPFGNFEDGTTMYHSPKVEEGDIIVFPSAIQHWSGVKETTSTKPRKIFSFNFRGVIRQTSDA